VKKEKEFNKKAKRTMKILVSNTWAFEKEINRLNKRAVKVGFAPITFVNLGQKTVTQRRLTVLHSDGEEAVEVRNIPVTVTEYELTVPSAEEYRWVLAATITPLEDGGTFVDRHIANFDVSRWQDKPSYCEHCHTNRHRNLTYIVQNKDDGRTLQVGRNCFADYVGHDGLAKLEFVQCVVNMFGSGDEDFIFPGGSSQREQVTSVRQVIAIAELIAEKNGWQNNVKDEYTGQFLTPGTHRIAADIARGCFTVECWGNVTKVGLFSRLGNEQDPIWKQVDEIIDTLRNMEPAAYDDFATQLCYCAGFEVVPSKKAALVAYAGQFLRNAQRRAQLEAKKATMQHVGTVGKREDFTVTLRKLVSFETDFGMYYIHIFEDANGNELVWKTSSEIGHEGQTFTLKATVKQHGERNGVKQTIISRAKVLC
jgi:hypothetical protein